MSLKFGLAICILGKSGISQNYVLESIQNKMKDDDAPTITWEKKKSFDEDYKKYM